MLYDDLSVFTKTDNFTIVLYSVKCYRLTVLAADYTFIDLKTILKILCVNQLNLITFEENKDLVDESL